MRSISTRVFVTAFAAVLCQAIAVADVIPFQGTTQGAFNGGAAADAASFLRLSFSGANSSSLTGPTSFSGTTQDGPACQGPPNTCGYANDIILGSFTLNRPPNAPGDVKDIYDGKTFTLTVNFAIPAGTTGASVFQAALHGTIHKNGANGDALDISFSDTPTLITFGPGANGTGSFDLRIDDIVDLGGGSPTPNSWTANLTGDISNMRLDPPPPPPMPAVPEPTSIVLFGTALVGAVVRRKRKA